MGGPPCQSVSGLNRHGKFKDIMKDPRQGMRSCAVACHFSSPTASQVPGKGGACAFLGHYANGSRRLMLSLLRERHFCRNHQMQVFYQVVDFFMPSWVLMENVQDIMTKVGSSHHVALKSVSLVCASCSSSLLERFHVPARDA